MKFRDCRVCLLRTICLLVTATSAFAQGGSTGRILGEITDQSGGVINGATVSVIDAKRGYHANAHHRRCRGL